MILFGIIKIILAANQNLVIRRAAAQQRDSSDETQQVAQTRP